MAQPPGRLSAGRLLPDGPCVAAKTLSSHRLLLARGRQPLLSWVSALRRFHGGHRGRPARVSTEPTLVLRGSSIAPGEKASPPTFAPVGLVSRLKSWSFEETQDPGAQGPGGPGFATLLAILGYRNAALRFQRQLFGTSWRWRFLNRNLEVLRRKATEQAAVGKGCRAGKGALALPIHAFLPWVAGSPGPGPVSWNLRHDRGCVLAPSVASLATRGRLCRRQGWASVRGGGRGAWFSPAARGWAPPRQPSKSSNGLRTLAGTRVCGWAACVQGFGAPLRARSVTSGLRVPGANLELPLSIKAAQPTTHSQTRPACPLSCGPEFSGAWPGGGSGPRSSQVGCRAPHRCLRGEAGLCSQGHGHCVPRTSRREAPVLQRSPGISAETGRKPARAGLLWPLRRVCARLVPSVTCRRMRPERQLPHVWNCVTVSSFQEDADEVVRMLSEAQVQCWSL